VAKGGCIQGCCVCKDRCGVLAVHARVWSLPVGLLPSQYRRRGIVFRVIFQQTPLVSMTDFEIRVDKFIRAHFVPGLRS